MRTSTHKKRQLQPSAHVRWMIRRDMPEVMAIEEKSFEFPWSEEDFIRCLRQRNCIGMVAERFVVAGRCEQIIGYMIVELQKPNRRERRKQLAILRNEERRHRRNMKQFSASLARSNIFVSTQSLLEMGRATA